MEEQHSPGRVYGGQSSAARGARRRQALLNAAIDTLIAGDKLTVRGVCTRTELTSRYFYENFRSTDELAEVAYDTCVAQIATAVASAFSTPQVMSEQISHAMNALVRQLETDPRAGHILFSHRIANRLVARKRQESTTFFALITAETIRGSVRSAVDVEQAAHFVVGGVTQLLSVWLNERYGGTPGTRDGDEVAAVATTMITALAAQLAVDLDAPPPDPTDR